MERGALEAPEITAEGMSFVFVRPASMSGEDVLDKDPGSEICSYVRRRDACGVVSLQSDYGGYVMELEKDVCLLVFEELSCAIAWSVGLGHPEPPQAEGWVTH